MHPHPSGSAEIPAITPQRTRLTGPAVLMLFLLANHNHMVPFKGDYLYTGSSERQLLQLCKVTASSKLSGRAGINC